jgi:hypothetical protein
MTIVLTPTPEYDDVLTAAEDGDDLDAALVAGTLQVLANRAAWARAALSGVLVWDGRLRAAAATAGLGVYVGPIKALTIGSSVLSQAAEAEIAGSLPLAGLSSFYFVYAYDNAGALALQASLDGPDASMTWKSTGLLTHRYLGAFKTDGAGAPIPLSAVRGVYQWQNALAAREVLAAGAATAATNVVCSAWAPPHARWLRLRMRTADTAGADKTSSLLPTGSGVTIEQGEAPSGGFGVHATEIPCDAARSFDYLVSTADARLKLHVQGWRE